MRAGRPAYPGFLDEKVSAFCAQHESPVLFLDYLQLVAAGRAGMTEKQTADAAVAMLKQLARRYDMPVIAASSLNREAYRPGSAEPGMSAFKESGSVEYSADLLLVLKYRTDADKEIKTGPRHLVLTILKTASARRGRASPWTTSRRKNCSGTALPKQPRAPEETSYDKNRGDIMSS